MGYLMNKTVDEILGAFDTPSGSVSERFDAGSDLQEGVSGQLEVSTCFENNERPRDVTPRNSD